MASFRERKVTQPRKKRSKLGHNEWVGTHETPTTVDNILIRRGPRAQFLIKEIERM